jgi:hypothetical protein
MLDSRKGAEPDDDSDTLRYCVLAGVGGSWAWAWAWVCGGVSSVGEQVFGGRGRRE